MKNLIEQALKAKIAAGKGSFHTKGAFKKRVSKREKTRQMFANNPEMNPWPLRTRLAGKFNFDFSEEAKRERRGK